MEMGLWWKCHLKLYDAEDSEEKLSGSLRAEGYIDLVFDPESTKLHPSLSRALSSEEARKAFDIQHVERTDVGFWLK